MTLPTARGVVWNDLGDFEQGQGGDVQQAGSHVGFGVPPGSLPGSHIVDDEEKARPRGLETGHPSSDQSLVFRTGAVPISGLLDLLLGLGTVGAGASFFSGIHKRQGHRTLVCRRTYRLRGGGARCLADDGAPGGASRQAGVDVVVLPARNAL